MCHIYHRVRTSLKRCVLFIYMGNVVSGSLRSINKFCSYCAKGVRVQMISLPRHSKIFIYTAQRTGATWSGRNCPGCRLASEKSDRRSLRSRVRHSTSVRRVREPVCLSEGVAYKLYSLNKKPVDLQTGFSHVQRPLMNSA